MLIPRRPLVLSFGIPLVLGVVALADRSLLWGLGATYAAIVLVAALDAASTRGRPLSITRQGPEVLSLGRENRVTLTVDSHSQRRFAARVTSDLFDQATANDLPRTITLEPRERARVHFHVVPLRRGAYSLGAIHARYASRLGLWWRQCRFEQSDPVRVYPDLQSLRGFDLMARQDREYGFMRATRRSGGESEFERLRDYSRDDEYRSIDWRATARNHRLIARQYQLESNQSVLFMLDSGRLMTAESNRTSLFDHALNATLMLARVASRAGDNVGLLAFDDAVRALVPPSSGPGATRKLIRASYSLHPMLVESDYDLAFRQLGVRVRKRSLVIVFTQVLDEGATIGILKHVASVSKRHLPLLVLFRDEGVESLVDSPARNDADLYVKAAGAETLHWRRGVIKGLKAAGAHVLDVRPEALTPALINRYLEIKARHLL